MDVAALGHDDIAEIGANWLRHNGYAYAFANMTSAVHGEQPDALGMNAWGESFLLEAKASRSDFLKDKKKHWRKDGNGIGMYRGYITPKGLLKPEEIPYGWWLLEVHGKTKPVIKVIKGEAYEMGWSSWDIQQGRDGDSKYKSRINVMRNMNREELNHFSKDRGAEYSFREELKWLLKIIKRGKQDGIEYEKYANRKYLKIESNLPET